MLNPSPHSVAALCFSPFGPLSVLVLLSEAPSSFYERLCAWLSEWGELGGGCRPGWLEGESLRDI